MSIQGFDSRLANARKAANLTQDQLASRLGVTPQAVSKWERGMGLPDIDLLCGIGAVLGCSVDALLGMPAPKITESGDSGEKERVMRGILAEPLVFEFGLGLVPVMAAECEAGLPGLQRIRVEMAEEYGMLLPVVHVRDNGKLNESEYRFLAYDKTLASVDVGETDGKSVDDIYGHMKSVCVENYDRILNRQIVHSLVQNVASRYPAVVQGLIPEIVSYACLQKVLAEMVKKKKMIRNMILIIEQLEEGVKSGMDFDELIDRIVSES